VRIIDGYNVIGAAGEFGLALSLPDKEVRLLRLLSSYRSRRRSRQPMLVFDDYGRLAAGPRRYTQLGIAVEWTLGEAADALIARKVRAAARPREIEVVTSDESVLRAIAASGAQGVRSPAFLAEISRASRRAARGETRGAGRCRRQKWLEIFGDGR
jgi:predicted RNA-binding protein with PIN domain